MKIFIGSDHRGLELRKKIIKNLKEEGFEIEESIIPNNDMDDYPDFAFDIGEKVATTKNSLGIVLCGNGIGISIAANKVKGIRCARVTNEDDAFKAKNHNGANMIAFAGTLSIEEAMKIVNIFLATKPASEERHLKRIEKIIKYEA